MSQRGEVKLSDFGIAKAEGRVSQTEVGLIKGNVSFMSPEQARGDAVDQRSDLFSAAVVLYYCLTGAVPLLATRRCSTGWCGRPAVPRSTEFNQLDELPPVAADVLTQGAGARPGQALSERAASSPAIWPATSPPAAPSSPT